MGLRGADRTRTITVVCLLSTRVIDGGCRRYYYFYITVDENASVGITTPTEGRANRKERRRKTAEKKIIIIKNLYSQTYNNKEKTHLFDGAVRHAQVVVFGASAMFRSGLVQQTLEIRFVLGQSLYLRNRNIFTLVTIYMILLLLLSLQTVSGML